MALAEVTRLERRCEALRSIALVAMTELTEEQLGRVRDRLSAIDAGEEPADEPPDQR